MSDRLDYAKDCCHGFGYPEPLQTFKKIYPFTTENIDGYIDLFDLQGTSLLTVGSSADQVINASLAGCTDITLLDICPYTKDYYYLKTSALEVLDYDDFLKFLCNKGFYGIFDNPFALSKKDFNKIKGLLKDKSPDSYYFWTEIFKQYKGTRVRQRLFSLDEDSVKEIIRSNPYLHDEESFLKARKKVKELNPNIMIGDIKTITIPDTYQNIWLSNLPAYLTFEEARKLFDKMKNYLTPDGKLLFSYLYGLTEDTNYNPEWAPIYNIKRVQQEISPELTFHDFDSVKDFKYDTNTYKDGVLVYQKTMSHDIIK